MPALSDEAGWGESPLCSPRWGTSWEHHWRQCQSRPGGKAPAANNHLLHVPQLRRQLRQGVPAHSPSDHGLLDYGQLSFVTRTLIAVAQIQIYWCNLLGTCEEVNREWYMSSQKSTGWIISGPVTLEVKQKPVMFSGLVLCLCSTRSCLFDFSILSGNLLHVLIFTDRGLVPSRNRCLTSISINRSYANPLQDKEPPFYYLVVIFILFMLSKIT